MRRSWSVSRWATRTSASLLAETEPRDLAETVAEQLVLGLDQLLHRPAPIAPDLTHRFEGAHQVNPSTGHHEHLAVDLRRGIAREPADDRSDVVWMQVIEPLLRRALGEVTAEVLGHACPSSGRDGVDRHVVALQLAGQGQCHRVDPTLGRGVVGLPDIAPEPGLARRVDDPAARLLARL